MYEKLSDRKRLKYIFTYCTAYDRRRDRAVSRERERRYGLDDKKGQNFLSSTSSTPALGSTQPPIQQVPGFLSPGVRQPRRKADHSPPTSAEVKKMWIYITTTPYVFMAKCLIS
jgi:hypothetical protein